MNRNSIKKEIAIIGMSCKFSKSDSLKAFWENLMSEKDLTGHATQQDFGVDPASIFHREKGVEDRCYSICGGYIRDFQFDPNGFELPADYLSKQDKLYQWSLYVAKEALKESGYLKNEEALKKCGVILGNLSFPTGQSHKMMSEIYSQTTQEVLRDLLGDENLEIPATNFLNCCIIISRES